MTREEAIEIIRKEYACVDADCDIERSCGKCELHMPSKEPILKAYEMAIKALSQEPCDDAEQIDYHDDFATALKKMQDYKEQQNDKKCGSYNNTNTFKSCINCKLIGTDSCYMVCGGSKSLYKPKQKIEPCDDAISREDAIKALQKVACYSAAIRARMIGAIEDLPSVTQKPIECDDAISRDMALEKMADYVASGYADSVEDFEEYSRIICQLPSVTHKSGKWIDINGIYAECSNCNEEIYITGDFNYCPNCGAKMVEPQESEDKE